MIGTSGRTVWLPLALALAVADCGPPPPSSDNVITEDLRADILTEWAELDACRDVSSRSWVTVQEAVKGIGEELGELVDQISSLVDEAGLELEDLVSLAVEDVIRHARYVAVANVDLLGAALDHNHARLREMEQRIWFESVLAEARLIPLREMEQRIWFESVLAEARLIPPLGEEFEAGPCPEVPPLWPAASRGTRPSSPRSTASDS